MLQPRQSAATSTPWAALFGSETGFRVSIDPNGNLTGDGSKTYEWDAENRLLAVNQGTHRSEFGYDGKSDLVRIVERENGGITEERRLLRCGGSICEERNAAGTVTNKRYFPNGVQVGGLTLFYTRDHLGSVRDLTDATGALRARYEYDPWGRQTKLSGDLDADFSFGGLMTHAATSLTFARYRAYDAGSGRWLSEDPSASEAVDNLYAYSGNGPSTFVDPSGLFEFRWSVVESFGDPDTACPGRKPAGACSRVTGLTFGVCVPEGDCYRPSTVLSVTGTITVFEGPFPYKNRKPVDKAVVDWWSAHLHEFYAHIVPAVAAAAKILVDAESKTYEKGKCEQVLKKALKDAREAFKRELHRNPS